MDRLPDLKRCKHQRFAYFFRRTWKIALAASSWRPRSGLTQRQIDIGAPSFLLPFCFT
jgi:hypothetical protein